MLDLAALLSIVAFFGLAEAYIHACVSLKGTRP